LTSLCHLFAIHKGATYWEDQEQPALESLHYQEANFQIKQSGQHNPATFKGSKKEDDFCLIPRANLDQNMTLRMLIANGLE
jgi:hypothetical protein